MWLYWNMLYNPMMPGTQDDAFPYWRKRIRELFLLNGSLKELFKRTDSVKWARLPIASLSLQRHQWAQLIHLLRSEWNVGSCSVTIHPVARDGTLFCVPLSVTVLPLRLLRRKLLSAYVSLDICVKILLGTFNVRCKRRFSCHKLPWVSLPRETTLPGILRVPIKNCGICRILNAVVAILNGSVVL